MKRESRDKGREGKRKYYGQESNKKTESLAAVFMTRDPVGLQLAVLPLH